ETPKACFLSLHDALPIFGSGYGVSNLREVEWLLHVEMLYWGDIDVQGFEILSQLRQYFPHTQSVLMDSDTFDEFFEKDAGVPSRDRKSTRLNSSHVKISY